MSRLAKICIAVAFVAVFLWISTEDYNHEAQQHDQYIEDVCAGYHPDYLDAKPNCEEVSR